MQNLTRTSAMSFRQQNRTKKVKRTQDWDKCDKLMKQIHHQIARNGILDRFTREGPHFYRAFSPHSQKTTPFAFLRSPRKAHSFRQPKNPNFKEEGRTKNPTRKTEQNPSTSSHIPPESRIRTARNSQLLTWRTSQDRVRNKDG